MAILEREAQFGHGGVSVMHSHCRDDVRFFQFQIQRLYLIVSDAESHADMKASAMR